MYLGAYSAAYHHDPLFPPFLTTYYTQSYTFTLDLHCAATVIQTKAFDILEAEELRDIHV